MGRKNVSALLVGAAALQVANAQINLPTSIVPTIVPTTLIPTIVPTTLVPTGIVTSVVGDVTSVIGGVTSVVGSVTGIVTSVVGDVTSVVGEVTSIVGSVTGIVTSVVGDVTSVVGGITTLIPTTIVVPTTVSTVTPTTTMTVIDSTTTEVTTLSPTSTVISTTITTLIPTVITTESTTETSSTLTTTSESTTSESTSTETTSSTSFVNAPQYTGNPWHVESNFGTVGVSAIEDGAGRNNLNFNLRTEFTLTGFGRVRDFFGTDVWYTLTGGNNQVFTDAAPAEGAKFRRQTNQQAITCQVATTGVMYCNGAAGNVFYTDGVDLYLGDSVPAGFSPVTLIAVLDDLSGTTTGTGSGTVGPTAVITQAPYWGNWGSGAIPSGVPVALTTCVTLPGPSGPITSTVTVTSLHCGCTETPIPTTIAMTTYVTTPPASWGYSTAVTVTVPATATDAAWQTWNGVVPTGTAGGNTGSTGGSSGSTGGTGSTGNNGYKPAGTSGTGSGVDVYKGTGSTTTISSAALALSAAMLVFFA